MDAVGFEFAFTDFFEDVGRVADAEVAFGRVWGGGGDHAAIAEQGLVGLGHNVVFEAEVADDAVDGVAFGGDEINQGLGAVAGGGGDEVAGFVVVEVDALTEGAFVFGPGWYGRWWGGLVGGEFGECLDGFEGVEEVALGFDGVVVDLGEDSMGMAVPVVDGELGLVEVLFEFVEGVADFLAVVVGVDEDFAQGEVDVVGAGEAGFPGGLEV